MMRYSYILLFLFVAVVLLQLDATAQCAMCKASIESNTEGIGSGINNGILYILAIPYILVSGIGYFIYRNHLKNQNVEN